MFNGCTSSGRRNWRVESRPLPHVLSLTYVALFLVRGYGGFSSTSRILPTNTTCILYTADSRGVFQSCGCAGQQVGGLARQATLIGLEANKTNEALVIDGGNVAGDRERALAVLRSLQVIGCGAVVLTTADEQLGESFLLEALKIGVPLVGSNRVCENLVVKEIGYGWVAVAGLHGSVETAMATISDLLKEVGERNARLLVVSSECGEAVDRQVAMSELGKGNDLAVILFSRGLAKPETLGGVHLIAAPKGGQEVCRVDITRQGKELRVKSALLPITPDLPEDKRVASVIAEHYRSGGWGQVFICHLTDNRAVNGVMVSLSITTAGGHGGNITSQGGTRSIRRIKTR